MADQRQLYSKSKFLSLPFKIRTEIYMYLLPSGTWHWKLRPDLEILKLPLIEMYPRVDDQSDSSVMLSESESSEVQNPIRVQSVQEINKEPCQFNDIRKVLQLCHMCRCEALSLIFPNVTIVINQRQDRGLSSALKLRPDTLASLRRLTVVTDGMLHRTSFTGQDRHQRLTEWQSMIHTILSYTRPGRLRLEIIFNGSGQPDIKAAKAVLAPLCQTFVLRQCKFSMAIRIEPGARALMNQIARLSVYKRKRRRKPLHFPFEKLPIKLRFGILTFTDLVLTRGHMNWSQSTGSTAHSPGQFGPRTGFEPKCPLPLPLRKSLGREASCPEPHSSIASNCHCQRLPHALFTVSKDVSALALIIFYSRNKFSLTVRESVGNYLQAHTSQLQSFLKKQMTNHTLWHLRFLEIGLTSGENIQQTKKWKQTLHDWRQALKFVRHKFNYKMFTLHISCDMVVSYDGDPEDEVEFEARTRYLLTVSIHHGDLLRSVGILKRAGLRQYFIHVSFHFQVIERSWDMDADSDADSDEDGDLSEEVRVVAKEIEQVVMGNSYDSAALGKPQTAEALRPTHDKLRLRSPNRLSTGFLQRLISVVPVDRNRLPTTPLARLVYALQCKKHQHQIEDFFHPLNVSS